jgi:putative spermidine/putrescine transport system permease protein
VLLQQQGVINDMLVWIGAGGSTTAAGDDQQRHRHDHRDDAYPAALHDPAALFGDEDDPAELRARREIARRERLDGVLAGLFPADRCPASGRARSSSSSWRSATTSRPNWSAAPRVFISNRIAYHISTSLNWGLAAALGTILLAAVLVLYWVYDRIVGIDNVKLG